MSVVPGAKQAKPRWRRRAEARPEEIIAAAKAVFTEKGFANTKLSEIAQVAGVTKGTLYYYFDGKEALFKAVIKEAVVPSLLLAEEAVGRYDGTTSELLGELVMAWWEKLTGSSICGLTKLIVAEAANFPELSQFYMDEVVARARNIYASVIRRGIKRGEIRDINVDWLVRELTSPVLFTAIWMTSMDAFEREPLDYDDYIRTHLDIVLNGILRPVDPSDAGCVGPDSRLGKARGEKFSDSK